MSPVRSAADRPSATGSEDMTFQCKPLQGLLRNLPSSRSDSNIQPMYHTLIYGQCITLVAVGGCADRRSRTYLLMAVPCHTSQQTLRSKMYCTALASDRLTALPPGCISPHDKAASKDGRCYTQPRRRTGANEVSCELAVNVKWVDSLTAPRQAYSKTVGQPCMVCSECQPECRPG